MNTRHAHFIDDVDVFDNEFFGISPVEAAALDPQQRLVLQSAWRAIEDAAIDPRSLAGTDTGVFVGMMSSEWGALNLLDYPALTPQRGIGGGHSMVANRVSYHLNLTGPERHRRHRVFGVTDGRTPGQSGPCLRGKRPRRRRGGEPHAHPRPVDLLHPGRAVRAGRSLQTVQRQRRRHRPRRGCRHRGVAATRRRAS